MMALEREMKNLNSPEDATLSETVTQRGASWLPTELGNFETLLIDEIKAGPIDVEVVKWLLKKGVPINAQDADGFTAVYWANATGQPEVARYLNDHGTLVESGGYSGVFHREHDRRNLNTESSSVNPSLQSGSSEDSTPSARMEVALTATTHDGWTSLHIASRAAVLEVVKFLVKNGAAIDAQTDLKWTPLHIACQYERLENVKFLVAHGAPLEATTHDGWTPLHIASRNGFLEIVKFLAQSGASLDAKTDGNWTPLHIASENGRLEVLEFLLTKGRG